MILNLLTEILFHYLLFPGIQRRKTHCLLIEDGSPASDKACDQGQRPTDEHECNQQPCPPEYVFFKILIKFSFFTKNYFKTIIFNTHYVLELYRITNHFIHNLGGKWPVGRLVPKRAGLVNREEEWCVINLLALATTRKFLPLSVIQISSRLLASSLEHATRSFASQNGKLIHSGQR